MRILLVDDHDLFREGLKFLLPVLDDRVQFCEAKNFDGARRAAGEGAVDLILLDYYLPGVVGMDALQQFREHFDAASVVIVSGEEDPRVIRGAIDNGAAGYIPKSSSREELVNALKLVLAGGTYLPASSLQNGSVRFGLDLHPAAEKVSQQLSRRQFEVLMKAIQGKANKVIARELDISDHTVKAHLSVAFRALGVQNRTEAVYVAAKLGMHPQQMPDENQ